MDFEALGAVPKDKLRQAKAASICLKTAPSKADTLLPEDHHYQVCHETCWHVTLLALVHWGAHELVSRNFKLQGMLSSLLLLCAVHHCSCVTLIRAVNAHRARDMCRQAR